MYSRVLSTTEIPVFLVYTRYVHKIDMSDWSGPIFLSHKRKKRKKKERTLILYNKSERLQFVREYHLLAAGKIGRDSVGVKKRSKKLKKDHRFRVRNKGSFISL